MIIQLEAPFWVKATKDDGLFIRLDAVNPQNFAETPVPASVAFQATTALGGQSFDCTCSRILMTNCEPRQLAPQLVKFQEVGGGGTYVSFDCPSSLKKGTLDRILTEIGEEGAFFLILTPPMNSEEPLLEPWKGTGAFLTQS